MTDLVGSLHLIIVNARFERDPVFSLGLVTALDLVLKNYPEPETGKLIKTAMITSVGLDEAEVDAEAAKLEAWAQGKTKDEIGSALKGEGDGLLSEIASSIKGDEWWMYSRFFGIGLIKLMEMSGVEQDMSVAYDVMEDWVGTCLGKPYYTACVSYVFCAHSLLLRQHLYITSPNNTLHPPFPSLQQSDSDLYFKQKGKLDMMETMMKEIEIREKKRMADRLEAKAEMAILAAEKAEKLQKITDDEEATQKEKVEA